MVKGDVLEAVFESGPTTASGMVRDYIIKAVGRYLPAYMEQGSLPRSYALYHNYPNPFNPQTTIGYDLPAAGQVRLEIYNVLGQKVKTLVDEYQNAGHQTVVWDGRDQDQRSVATGIYFYRLTAGDFTASRKMMLLK